MTDHGAPSSEEYHEALNGLWVAFAQEFRANADLFVVRRMNDVLRRGHAAKGWPISVALGSIPDEEESRVKLIRASDVTPEKPR